jgi:hypothetical protein
VELPQSVRLPLTPSAKRALEFARDEATGLNHTSVVAEHLLLGLLREPESTAAVVLRHSGLTLEALREAMARRPEPENRDSMLQSQPAPSADPSSRNLEHCLTEKPLPAEVLGPGVTSRNDRPASRKDPLEFVFEAIGLASPFAIAIALIFSSGSDWTLGALVAAPAGCVTWLGAIWMGTWDRFLPTAHEKWLATLVLLVLLALSAGAVVGALHKS